MSARAAARLETIGFTQVYDYVAGKADWGSAGLPLDGRNGSGTRAGAYVRRDGRPAVSTTASRPSASSSTRAAGTPASSSTSGASPSGASAAARSAARDVSAEDAMTPGPSTIRPSARVEKVIERMRRQNLTSLPVTTAEGKLLGLLLRQDAEAAAGRR